MLASALFGGLAACGGTNGREGLPPVGSNDAASPDAGVTDASSADGTARDAGAPDSTGTSSADAAGDMTVADVDEGMFDVNIPYADRVLPDVRVVIPNDSGADAEGGALDGGAHDGSACIPYNTPPFPCADAGAACGNGGRCDSTGVCVDGGSPPPVGCTPTEQRFVDKSVACYTCLVNAGCLNDVVFSGDSTHECEDLTGTATGGARAGASNVDLCLAALDCIFATSCAAMDPALCYCGMLVGSACATSMTPGNGVCAQSQADGVGLFVTAPASAVSPTLGNSNLASGKADAIFNCALGNVDQATGKSCATFCNQ